MRFNYQVTELNIGVADDTYPIGIEAENRRGAVRKMLKYLSNKYEDTLTFWPPLFGEPGLNVMASMQRHGGSLKIEALS